MALENIAIVLVRPLKPGNIGSVARALKNMGLSDLRLVAPEASPSAQEALAMAVHARDVLESARIYPKLADALSDRTLVVGTTCREGLYRAEVRPLRETALELVATAGSNKIAILFGAEDTGLTNRELKSCQRLIRIPSGPQYASLNLAQAVMVVAYELWMASAAKPEHDAGAEYAPAMEIDAMLERMKDALLAIGFLPENNPEHIMFALRAIYGRSGLTARELDILSGIASQTRWAAEGGHIVLKTKRTLGKKLR
ncbi:MAG TPA: RNA methyltransferase [Candidatus Binataceae bacterium]|nr:RNA methyltransferase [Candidatus Binataceae bacterium]